MSEAIEAAISRALESTQTESGSSRWKELARCPQAHDLRYRQNLVAKNAGSLALDVGILVHAALRFVGDMVLALGRFETGWRELQNYEPLLAEAERRGADPWALTEARRLLRIYFERYGSANAGYPKGARILGLEVELKAELTPGVEYTGRADAIIEWEGEIVLVDHKTRSRVRSDSGGDLERELRAQPQFLGLAWLWSETTSRYRSDGKREAPPSVLVNDIIKTKTPAFERHFVRFEPSDLEAWRVSMLDLLHTETSQAPRRNLYACAPEIGFRCDYFTHCHGSDEERARDYETKEEGK